MWALGAMGDVAGDMAKTVTDAADKVTSAAREAAQQVYPSEP